MGLSTQAKILTPKQEKTILTSRWLRVLGPTETPHIDQGVGHQLHAVVALLDVFETEQQPLEFILPCKRPLHAIP